MSTILGTKKTEYMILNAVKQEMSQMFDENSKVVPFTTLKLLGSSQNVDFIKGLASLTKIKIEGTSKGRGFAGVMKRWDFSGGPATHGQKDRARSAGSIGTQGQNRVVKGKKMPGHYGNEKISIITYYLGFDVDKMEIKVKGGVPGARNSKVYLYFNL